MGTCDKCRHAQASGFSLAFWMFAALALFVLGLVLLRPDDAAPSTQLSQPQADMVLDCWGNGWDAEFVNDGDGGVQIRCKAAY